MKSFNFTVHPKVISGPGSIRELTNIVEKLGCRNPLIITDSVLGKTGIPQRVQSVLHGSKLFDGVEADPKAEHVNAALQVVHKNSSDLVIAIGGGSAIDVAKLASVLRTNPGSLAEYAERWEGIVNPGLPLITIPTTIGSGSEVTRGAVFGDAETHIKKVVISDHLAACFTILDPELLETLPASVAASTGADALTQAIEGVISTNSNTYSDALHLHAIRLIKDSLRPAVANPKNILAMGNMQQAASMVGAAMGYSGVGAAHAIANTLGGHYRIPHGIACAIMLQPVLRFNSIAVPDKYRFITEAMGIPVKSLRDWEVVDALAFEVQRLLEDIGITKGLGDFGIMEEAVPKLALEAHTHSDMVCNPRLPNVGEVEKLIRQAL